jgi:sugar lactone lactonase YvrE
LLRYRHISLLSVIALTGLATVAAAFPASAATAPLSEPQVVAHFNVTAQEQPEDVALAPAGVADVTFNRARQVAQVGTDGSVTILATLPASATGTGTAAGIVRAPDGTLYVNYNAGSQSGIYRIPPAGGTPVEVVALPDVKDLNDLAADWGQDALYATDSSGGTVWKVSLRTGTASVWAQGVDLQSKTSGSSGLGANGIQVHNAAVWVSNTDKGTLLRIPFRPNGTAGAITTKATGLTAIDNFAFTGQGDTVLAALNYVNQVAVVYPDGTHQTVLTAADGLSNPTDVAVRGSTAYVTDGAYFTRVDPNLLTAKLSG